MNDGSVTGGVLGAGEATGAAAGVDFSRVFENTISLMSAAALLHTLQEVSGHKSWRNRVMS